jgi:GT2 family glycosyltransferase
MAAVKTSVCIPTYNGELFVAAAIQSVLQQSFADFELLVVDDCSQDATWEIVSAFSDPRVKTYRNEQRQGIPGNWNRCLALARGEYLCLFHQDDLMLPENLARKVDVLATDPTVGLVHSAVEVIVEDSAPRSPSSWGEENAQDVMVNGLHYFRKLLLWGNLICAPSVVCRRQALVDIGGFNEQLHFACDYEAWLCMCVRYNIAFLKQPLVRYRWHGSNETHRFWFEDGIEETAAAVRNALQYYAQWTGRQSEVTILEEAAAALRTVRTWLAHAEKGREGWANGCRNLEKVAEQLRADIADLQTHAAWLEERKGALEQEVQTLQAKIEPQKKALEELLSWITMVEEMRVVQLLSKLHVLPLPPTVTT